MPEMAFLGLAVTIAPLGVPACYGVDGFAAGHDWTAPVAVVVVQLTPSVVTAAAGPAVVLPTATQWVPSIHDTSDTPTIPYGGGALTH